VQLHYGTFRQSTLKNARSHASMRQRSWRMPARPLDPICSRCGCCGGASPVLDKCATVTEARLAAPAQCTCAAWQHEHACAAIEDLRVRSQNVAFDHGLQSAIRMGIGFRESVHDVVAPCLQAALLILPSRCTGRLVRSIVRRVRAWSVRRSAQTAGTDAAQRLNSFPIPLCVSVRDIATFYGDACCKTLACCVREAIEESDNDVHASRVLYG